MTDTTQSRLFERSRQVGYLEETLRSAIWALEHNLPQTALDSLRDSLANYSKEKAA